MIRCEIGRIKARHHRRVITEHGRASPHRLPVGAPRGLAPGRARYRLAVIECPTAAEAVEGADAFPGDADARRERAPRRADDAPTHSPPRRPNTRNRPTSSAAAAGARASASPSLRDHTGTDARTTPARMSPPLTTAPRNRGRAGNRRPNHSGGATPAQPSRARASPHNPAGRR